GRPSPNRAGGGHHPRRGSCHLAARRHRCGKKNDTAASAADAREAEIVSYLRQRYHQEPVREGPPRRGFAGQRLERVQEQTARRHVVEAGKDLQAAGWHWADTADFFHLAPRTLRHWRQDRSLSGVRMVPLGRPIQAADRQERNAVIDYLDDG